MVLPGSYGAAGTNGASTGASTRTPTMPEVTAGTSGSAGARAPTAGMPTTSTPGASGSGSAGQASAMGGSAADPAQPMSTAGDGAAGAAGMKAPQASAGSGGMAGQMQPAAGSGEPSQPCDMSGRWLVTVHYVTDALGALQYCHTFNYFEIKQTAEAFTITKGLNCGDEGEGGGDLAASINFSGSWPSVAKHVSHAGRTGTSKVASGGCQVDVSKFYTVRGATFDYYKDPSKPLPSAEEPAMGSSPGWEDWDGDGNPGITGMISGVVTGKIFVAPRQWTQMTGAVPDVMTSFKLKLMWDQEQNVMSYDGSPLLSGTAVRASDAALHFVQFARLADDQGVGADDAAICASVQPLAKTLTPEAAAGPP